MTQFPPGPNDHLFGMRTMSQMKADVLGYYTHLHRKYGDVVSFRTGPYRLFVFYHPDHVREILVSQAKSTRRLPRVMQTLAQWNGNSLLIAEGKQWIRQRRLVQPAFQPRRMQQYGQTMVHGAEQLVDSWRPAMKRDGFFDVDVDKAMMGMSLSTICRTMFNRDIGELSADVAKAVAILSEVAFREMQAPLRMPIWVPTVSNREKRRAIKTLDDVVRNIVRERRAEGGDHGDLLSMLLATVDEESGQTRLTDEQVRDEVTTLMLAGHDTTAAAFDWLWYALATHPDVAKRCQDEIALVIGQRKPQASDVEQLPFLVAAIKETLRLYPPAIGVFLRQVTETIKIGGYTVPCGSLVTLSSFVTHRDARWFENPERFDPERFLMPREEAIPPLAYFPFGAGPRVCIGQAFAMTELVLVAATILKQCTVTTAPTTVKPQLHVTMALRPKDPLMLRWKLRE